MPKLNLQGFKPQCKLYHLPPVTPLPKEEFDALPHQAIFAFPNDHMMHENEQASQYQSFSLEKWASHLSNKNPFFHIVLLLPDRTKHDGTIWYDRLVEVGPTGAPAYRRHGHKIVDYMYLVLQLFNQEISVDIKAIHIIGFGKGCFVLNQLVYELAKCDLSAGSKFSKFSWIDGGHKGGSETWITDVNTLFCLRRLKIDVEVIVSPYQIDDPRRPFVKEEEETFSKFLQTQLGDSFNRIHAFQGEDCNINTHMRTGFFD